MNEYVPETGGYQEHHNNNINLEDQTDILPQVDENIIDIHTNQQPIEEAPQPVIDNTNIDSPKQNNKTLAMK